MTPSFSLITKAEPVFWFAAEKPYSPIQGFHACGISAGFGPGAKETDDCPLMTPGAQSKSAASSSGNSWKGNLSRDFAEGLIALCGLLPSILRAPCPIKVSARNGET